MLFSKRNVRNAPKNAR